MPDTDAYAFRALRVIKWNGVIAFQPGDPVPASSIEALRLREGEDVERRTDNVRSWPRAAEPEKPAPRRKTAAKDAKDTGEKE